MANTNAPFGFSQRSGIGSVPTFEQYEMPNGGIDYNGAAIYFNDPVQRAGATPDGTLIQSPGGNAGSTPILAGVFQGCKYLNTSIGRTVWSNYWPGGSPVSSANQSTISAWVINDANAQFVVQSDATGVTQSQVGGNIDFAIGTGNTSNGFSGAYILHTVATATGYPWRLMSLVLNPPGANGTQSGAYNYAIVSFGVVETRGGTSVV